ncbi:MAG: PAS domain S-box protein [Limnospira sp.]
MQDEGVSKSELIGEIDSLRRQLEAEKAEKRDLELLLETITEHSTQLENQIQSRNKVMARYIQQVEKITAAAVRVENNTFEPGSLNEIGGRDDELGTLARVFQQMVETVKTREQQLAAAKEQLEAVLNAVPGAISWMDSGGFYLGVNRHLADTWGLSPEYFVGKKVGFLHQNSRLVSFITQFLEGENESDSRVVEVEIGDSLKYYLVVAQKYGQGSAIVSVGIDITDRRNAEEALRIAEENYRSIFENALEGIFQSSLDGHYISVNPAMAQIYGYDSPAEMLDRVTAIATQIYVNPGDRLEFQRRLKEEGAVKNFESQIYRKDGSIIWIEEDTRAVRDSQGNILYYEGIVKDISQRKQEEENLKRQIQELKIEIDQQKREKEVAEITGSDYFKELQMTAESLRFDDEDW